MYSDPNMFDYMHRILQPAPSSAPHLPYVPPYAFATGNSDKQQHTILPGLPPFASANPFGSVFGGSPFQPVQGGGNKLVTVRHDPKIDVTLENSDLWQRFHKFNTEMIITKTGRRMFPTVKCKAKGLDPQATYFVLLDLVLADDCRYKYTGKEWVVAGKAEPQMPCKFYVHPDSPATGAQWMKHDISFQKVKLTNNNLDQNGHMILTSMHKYTARVHLVRADDTLALSITPITSYNTFPFTETTFLGVTAYQNEQITKLKIDNNPFAKGFRENGQVRPKRRSIDSSGGEDDEVSDPKRLRPEPVSPAASEEDDEVFVSDKSKSITPTKPRTSTLDSGLSSSSSAERPTSSTESPQENPMMKRLELEAKQQQQSLSSPALPPPFPPYGIPPYPSYYNDLYYHQLAAARYSQFVSHHPSLYASQLSPPPTSLSMLQSFPSPPLPLTSQAPPTSLPQSPILKSSPLRDTPSPASYLSYLRAPARMSLHTALAAGGNHRMKSENTE